MWLQLRDLLLSRYMSLDKVSKVPNAYELHIQLQYYCTYPILYHITTLVFEYVLFYRLWLVVGGKCQGQHEWRNNSWPECHSDMWHWLRVQCWPRTARHDESDVIEASDVRGWSRRHWWKVEHNGRMLRYYSTHYGKKRSYSLICFI